MEEVVQWFDLGVTWRPSLGVQTVALIICVLDTAFFLSGYIFGISGAGKPENSTFKDKEVGHYLS